MPVVEKRKMFFRRFDGEDCLEPGVFGTRHPHAGQPNVDPGSSSSRRLPPSTAAADASATAPATTTSPLPIFMRAASEPRIVGIGFACQEVDARSARGRTTSGSQMIATERALIEAERSV